MFFSLCLLQKILQINCNRSKQTTKIDADPKSVQQINFTENLDRAEVSTMFFINEEAKESFRFFKRTS